MKIYISGISGTGMGPLALMAVNAGYEVCGSDLAKGAIYDELVAAGIDVYIGEQDGEFLQKKLNDGVDWFVHTSALPATHAELVKARAAGVKISKRDELTAFLVEKLGLKMVAVAGTHGKTTTTSMIAYAALKMHLPVAYIVGTTLGFAPSGSYHNGDKYFIYEADEYDRNFLKFHPWLAVITSVSYDHPDIYPTREDYKNAFSQFKSQSEKVIDGNGVESLDIFNWRLAGEARRYDARLAFAAVMAMQNDLMDDGEVKIYDPQEMAVPLMQILNDFPGVGRRFERLADGIYTDYAHHPEEIAATMDVALDECKMRDYKGVVVVYQPHQNTRQHEVADGYAEAFRGATKVYWLPTYLTREDPNLAVLTSEDLIAKLVNKDVAEPAELDNKLFSEILRWRGDGYLVILMTAGPADAWLRAKIT